MKPNFERQKGGVGRLLRALALGALFTLASILSAAQPAAAAGLLKPLDGPADDIRILSHRVEVVIDNGFARTEVEQIFGNDAQEAREAVYTFPLPKQASLSELSLLIDGRELLGEVVEAERARRIYEEQQARGEETALAEKNDFKTFDISVGNIPPGGETTVRLVYYQPLEIDLNVGRYLYPLAEGGVDEERIAFWSVDDRVDGPFSFHLLLKSAFPVKDVRLPGLMDRAVIQPVAQPDGAAGDVFDVTVTSEAGDTLSKDIVFYYRLDETVPARLELVPFRDDPAGPGTFMVVVTPGADLKPITEGTDWVFVLDVSGSMGGGKIATLTDGVGRVLGKLSPRDRFRIVTFNDGARELTSGYVRADPARVNEWISRVRRLEAGGGTALYAGVDMGFRRLEADRTTGMILVTDGVANIGPTEHRAFLDLIGRHDLRLFSFVIGNSANQPLMERMAKASNGFAMNISESDDIAGRLVQAKAKVLNECLHDVQLDFHGEQVTELTPADPGSLYLGQQLVMFGRYDRPGEVTVDLSARISGKERFWRTTVELPEIDDANPEIERLWALSRIDGFMEKIRDDGENEELIGSVVDLGVDYSLVTDYTSMVVVQDEVFEEEGIDRKNARRVDRERAAQNARAGQGVRNYRVDNRNGGTGMFNGAPSPGVGSGPVGPLFVGAAWWLRRRKRKLRVTSNK